MHAIAYPLILLGMAWCLFSSFVFVSLNRIYFAATDLGVALHPVLDMCLGTLFEYPGIMMVVPGLGAALLLFWMLSGRASSMAFRGPERILLLLPGVGGLVRDMRFYTLTRMLALLVEKQLPLNEALIVAGASCGSAGLDTACQKAAEQVTQGNPSGLVMGKQWQPGQLPPLLQVCLKQTATDGNRLILRLRAIAQHYRARMDFNSAWLRIVMPVILFVVIAGGTTLLYAASVFWPVIEIYRSLS